MAITTSSNLFCYNAQIVKEAGLDPDTPPKDIAELDLWAEKLTIVEANGSIKRVGFRPSYLWHWGHVFGGSFYDEANQKITANDAKIIAALDWIASYAKKWDITKIEAFESGFGSYAGATNPFLAGLQASVMTGEWMIEYAKAFKPELEPQLKYIASPAPADGFKDVTVFGGSIFTAPRGVKYPDASWEFIRFIQDPQIGGTFARDIANLQPAKATLSDPRYISDPRIKLGLELQSGPHAYGVLPIPVNSMYQTELGKAETFVLHGEKTSKEALDDVTALIQSELDLVLKGGQGR
jgi:multiple sugar transport system substrate-binding protein